MTELSKDLIGHKLPKFSMTVERGKIKEFCKAIGETNPIYLDSEAAKAEGYSDTPAPPTFQTAFTFWGYETFWEDLEKMGIDVKRLLHMKEEYTYGVPMYPGDTINIEGLVSDVKIGKMNMVTIRNIMKNDKGETCVEAEQSIVIRPEGM